MGRLLTIDDYEITRDGQVINKTNGHVLKPQPNGKGYLRVSISKKLCFVHRLVAEKYIPNPNNYEQVNHKDGNKLNNSVENLEWVSNQQNRNHAIKNDLYIHGSKCPWAKLNEDDVIYIRTHNHLSNEILAEKFNVSLSTIRDVKNYRTWKNVKVEKIC